MPQHEEDLFLSHSLPDTPHLSDLNKEGSCCKFILNVNDLTFYLMGYKGNKNLRILILEDYEFLQSKDF